MLSGALIASAGAAGNDAVPVKAATLYVSKLSLEKRFEDALANKNEKPNFYCAEDFAKLERESDAGLKALSRSLHACADDRVLLHRPEVLRIVYVAEQNQTACTTPDDVVTSIDEHARKTAASAGFAAVLKAALGKGLAKEGDDKLCFVPFEHTLVYDRATADVSVSLKSEPQTKVNKQLITGATEHWFLSGDAIVKGAKELKYDADKKAVFARDKPDQLYLGINWMLGDVYGRYDRFAKERLVGKLMLLPSRHPFDSVGVGMGYRFADGVVSPDVGIQPTGGFMVFVGHFWTKNEGVDSSGNVAPGGRSRSWRFGVSYGLDSLLGWLK